MGSIDISETRRLISISLAIFNYKNLIFKNNHKILQAKGHYYLTLGTVTAQSEMIHFAMKNQYKGYSSV